MGLDVLPPHWGFRLGIAFSVPIAWLISLGSSQAHQCGPGMIELKVGESCLWRIHADLTESLTLYTPSQSGSGGVAEIFPRKPFFAHHGDFVIAGVAPGTNDLSVVWFYQPTPAARTCNVKIVVKPADGQISFQTPVDEGSLIARDGADEISATQLHSLITNCVPAETPKLLVFTECFGGSIGLSPLFRAMPNTAIASGTSPNQEGRYGGYHDDAARALRPQAGRTGLDVHEEGSAGKSTHLIEEVGVTSKADIHQWSEWPRTAGALALDKFSLDPVQADGPVRSRHIVVFMGRPQSRKDNLLTPGGFTVPDASGVKTEIRDASGRDQIRSNFQGQVNTTITSAGGDPHWWYTSSGVDGWDHPGDLDGLKRAIATACEGIKKSPDPSKEQFILYVGDHGGRGRPMALGPRKVVPNSRSELGSSPGAWAPGDPVLQAIERQPDGKPQLRFRVDFPEPPRRSGPSPAVPPGVFNPGDLALEVTPEGGVPIALSRFHVTVVDLDDDGTLDSLPGEGTWVYFDLDKRVLLDRLVGHSLSLTLVNQTSATFLVSDVALLTGGIANWSRNPPPQITRVRLLGTGGVELTVAGESGRSYSVERSAASGEWSVIADRVFQGFTETFQLPPSVGATSTFFRVRTPER